MPESVDARRPLRVALATAAAVLSGTGVALQSRINGQLGAELGDGFAAAFLSFSSGLVLLAIGMLLAPAARRGVRRVVAAVRSREIPWWFLVGGASGAFFVLIQSLVIGVIGVALFTVGVVGGQLVSSLLIDRRGFGTMPAQRLTLTRAIGALVAIVGVVLAVSGQVRADVPLWMLIAPFAVGLAVGFQQAANGQVRAVAGSPLAATFGNFLVGTVLLTVALGIHLIGTPWPATFPASPVLYLGGVVGIVFIWIQVIIVRTIGVLLLGLGLLSGQLAAAVLFDVLLPVEGHTFAFTSLLGAAITLVAVVVAALPARRGTPSAEQAPSPE